MPLLDHIREKKLIWLAHERFASDLSDAELKVLHDSASSLGADTPAANAARPTIRPEFVRWLATDKEAAANIDPKGLRAFGITLSDKLDFQNCRVLVPLHFQHCTFDSEIDFRSAETRDIILLDSSFNGGITADRIKVDGPLFLRGGVVSGEIRLIGAQIKGALDCLGAKLRVSKGNALSADRAEIGGIVYLQQGYDLSGTIQGFESTGTIRLLGAKIKGDLSCSGAKLRVKEGVALYADGAEIGGSVFLNAFLDTNSGRREDFESTGTIRLLGARIKIGLDCSGARLEAKEGDALSADGAEIGGNVSLTKGFTAVCTIILRSARIGGDLRFYGAEVAEVNCMNLRISGDLLWMGIRKSGKTILRLTGAELKNLREDQASRPDADNLVLDGLVYEELSLHERPSDDEIKKGLLSEQLKLNLMDRVDWLMLQPYKRRLEPQPWMQLSKHLEGRGDRKGAKHVIFKYRGLLAHTQDKLWILRRLKITSAWMEEAPTRICWSIALTLIVGTFIFAGASRSGAMLESVQIQPNAAVLPNRESKPASIHYPPFQPFVYTLENAVPLVKLGMDDRWMPDYKHQPQPWFPQTRSLDWLKWFNSYWFLVISRWGLIVWGWVQATILAVSVADRFKK
jgi:hypothetical protein